MAVGVILSIVFFSALLFHIMRKYYSKKMNDLLTQEKNNSQSVVAKESEKVAVIVDNLQQALFAVGAGGLVVEPITKFTEKIFGQNIAGESLMQTLYKSLNYKSEVYDSVASALVTVMGEGELQWDLVESNFPRKVQYTVPGLDGAAPAVKLLKVNISPIWDSNQNLERLLFVVEDITDLEKMELQFKQEQEQTGMVECVLDNSLEDLSVAIKQFHKLITECRSLAVMIDPLSFMDLQRILHTVKGNARQLKMRVLSDQVHQSESLIMNQMSSIIHSDDSEPITLELDKIEKVLAAHLGLIQKFLRSETSWGEGVLPVYPLALNQAESVLENSKELVSADVYIQLQMAMLRLGFKSVAALSAKFTPMVSDLAKELGKKVDLAIEGDALASAEQAATLHDCLVHLIRNSLDHGFESPETRLAKGKPEVGQLKIYSVDKFDSLTIVVSDDGSGIDAERVTASALSKELITPQQAAEYSAQEKLHLIFLPNFSTKTIATEISGRGVGMDVVKEKIEKMGGQLTLQSEKNKGLVITIKLYNTAFAGPLQKTAA